MKWLFKLMAMASLLSIVQLWCVLPTQACAAGVSQPQREYSISGSGQISGRRYYSQDYYTSSRSRSSPGGTDRRDTDPRTVEITEMTIPTSPSHNSGNTSRSTNPFTGTPYPIRIFIILSIVSFLLMVFINWLNRLSSKRQ